MKQLTLFCLGAFCLASATIMSQTTAKKYPEPDFQEKPYYFDEAKNELIEMQAGNLIQDTRRSGYIKAEEFYYVDGEKSTTRFKKSAKILFVTKMQTLESDPAEYFKLMKLNYNPKKKQREVVTEQQGTYNNSKNPTNVKIFFKVKNGQEIYEAGTDYPKFYIRVLVVENLEPGEYVWRYGLRDAAFFGIDE
ncbi:MAG: hypothetical protein ACXVPQ_02760 [Bacteroidia bacterium]